MSLIPLGWKPGKGEKTWPFLLADSSLMRIALIWRSWVWATGMQRPWSALRWLSMITRFTETNMKGCVVTLWSSSNSWRKTRFVVFYFLSNIKLDRNSIPPEILIFLLISNGVTFAAVTYGCASGLCGECGHRCNSAHAWPHPSTCISVAGCGHRWIGMRMSSVCTTYHV